MKNTLYILLFFASAFSFAQNTGSINGSLIDFESENQPLVFAKVLIKETGSETSSDENGLFKFENLQDGTYTLVYSFVGYETKEIQYNVVSGKVTKVKSFLKASSVSLDDLTLAFASAEK